MSLIARTFTSLATVALTAAFTQPQTQPPCGGSPKRAPAPSYQRAGQLPARIMEFKAEPAAIQPGQAVTLTWATENPTNSSIDPDLGRVTPRGVREIKPVRTTTYILTVHGPNNQTLTRELTVNVAGTTAAPRSEATLSTAASGAKEVPRVNGQPDLSGVFDISFGGGGRGAATPQGPVLKPGAEKYKIVRAADDQGQYADCMPLAGPQAFAVPYQFQIVESARSVAILNGLPRNFPDHSHRGRAAFGGSRSLLDGRIHRPLGGRYARGGFRRFPTIRRRSAVTGTPTNCILSSASAAPLTKRCSTKPPWRDPNVFESAMDAEERVFNLRAEMVKSG